MAGVVAASLPHALVGVFYDDGIYLALAKSLAEGHGYHLRYLPGSPPAVHYPVLYPAFLALLWKLWPTFPDNVTLFRAANAALMGSFAGLLAAHLGSRLGWRPWIVSVVVATAATAIPLLAVATVLFAEPLFLVLAAGSLWAADGASAAEGRRAGLLALVAGVLAGLSALTRSIGLAVVLGVVLEPLSRRRPRLALASLLPASLMVLPWYLWVAAHRGTVDPAIAANYGTYGDLAGQAGLGWSLASLREVVGPLAAISLPPAGALWPAMAAFPIVVLVVGIAALAGEVRATGLTLICYLGIVAVWPYAPERFLWAVVPWLALAFIAGQRRLLDAGRVRQLSGRLAPALAITAAAIVISGYALRQAIGFTRGYSTTTQRGISRTVSAVLPWIRAGTDSSAVIAGEDEALWWLYTGRRAVPSYLWRVRGRSAVSLGPDTLHAYLDRTGATHLVLTGPRSDAAPDVDALLARYPGYLRVVQVWPEGMIAFAIERPGR